ncbi:unnamed protein product [Rotaria sp. Silwood1]|nr:unnamed protein product [Rotaria sp. Silwood1]CAF3391667.1 unnamed protein product [Rotaria sp. Silwood1]CAF4564935.1 unnamed protein product [Rotaria sp. Silwood1]CAF4599908.1 unnamed protein product [Rotaria sp. Silwood1]
MCLSLHECNRTINGTEMSFTCPSIVGSQELRLYDLTVAQLNSITSLIVTGNENIVGPFTRIPANICLLRNLQKIDFSYNQIIEADPTGSLTQCLTNVVTLNLTSNNISKFPSFMIYNMPSLKNLYFQDNLLTEIPVNAFTDVSSLEIIDFSYNNLTTFELWALEVKTKADFSYNQISTITNKYFFKKILNRTIEQGVYLSNNSAAINFTDAVYEMYNQCEEVYQWYFSNMDLPMQPWFTWKLAYIDFGTTRIDCSCDQAYFLRVFKDSSFLEGQIYPIQNAMCSNNSLGVNDTTLWNSSCASPIFETNSTVDFSQVYPKLCKITEDEGGELTNVTDIDPPTLNASFYPNYTTASLNPGACYFSFSNSTSMMIRCTNDTSNSASRIPTDLLSSPYMSNITHITFSSSISSLPSYVCSLPSGEIDLSFQAFTTLNDTTFPCLDSFRTINLSFNQLTSVNMKNGNLKNLTSLDLSSNKLTSLPYSILDPTPTSLRYLDLRNNSINYLDLFIFTLKNITINLDNNPINSSNIINPQNVTLGNNDTSTVNITFPATVKNSTIPITDEIALTYGICQNFQSLRNNLLKLQSTVSHVVLVCTCVSINLKQIYQQNGYNITNDFQCSTAGDEETFYALNMTSCSNVTDFKSGLCAEPPPTTVAPPLQSNNNDSNSSRTALIIGLVVGLGCSLLLVVAILVVIYIVKAKGAVSGVTKRVDRAPVTNQAPEDSLQSRVQSRSFRSVKLAPIIHKSAPLPATPVAAVIPTTASTTASHTNTKLRSSSKGISLRLDSIRSPSNVNPQYPPNSNALNNTSSFRPIDKLSLHPPSIPEQEYQVPKPQKPRTHPMLNAGGDTRY